MYKNKAVTCVPTLNQLRIFVTSMVGGRKKYPANIEIDCADKSMISLFNIFKVVSNQFF